MITPSLRQTTPCGYGSLRSQGRHRGCGGSPLNHVCHSNPLRLLRLRKAIVQCVARAADGADRVLLAAEIEQLAQAPDMDVDGALVDVDVTAPDAVEQLLAREHAAGMLQEELQQAIFGRAEIDRPARACHAAL